MRLFKAFWLTSILLFAVLATARDRSTVSMTGFQLIEPLNAKLAKSMTRLQKDLQISDVQILPKSISFHIKKSYFQFEFIGQSDVFVRINGVDFSAVEMKSRASIRKALDQKLKLYRRARYANHWSQLLIGKAFALEADDFMSETTTTFQNDLADADEDNASANTVNLQAAYTEYDVGIENPQPKKNKSFMARQLQVANRLFSGDNFQAATGLVETLALSISLYAGNSNSALNGLIGAPNLGDLPKPSFL